jgi:hypothetical protein
MVDIKLFGAPGGPLSDSALLDSGADGCAFPLQWMKRLGIEMDNCDPETLETAGGPSREWTYRGVMLDLFVCGQMVPVKGVFSDTPVALLGRGDVFARFRITFDQKKQRFRMDPYEDSPSGELSGGAAD